MNILLINHERPPVGGGGGVFTNLLARGLAEAGSKVFFLTPGQTDSVKEEKTNFYVITLKTARNNYANIKFTDLFELWLKFPQAVNRIIKDYNIDIVNPHFIHSSGIVNYLSFNKLPYIVTALGADIYDPTRYKIIRGLMNFAGGQVIKNCKNLVLSSADMYARAHSLFPELKNKLRIIPHCIDCSVFERRDKNESKKKLNIDTKHKIIISVCRLVKRKNLMLAIDVVNALLKRGCNIKYLIIGEGPQKNELKEKVEELGINDAVEFLDYVSESELPLYYSAADVFFMPSHHEAFGIAALEAMAAKTPPVCSNNGGWTDFIINYKTGFVCADYEGYVNRIYELITYDKLWRELSECAAREVLNTYDYKKIALEYLKLYNN